VVATNPSACCAPAAAQNAAAKVDHGQAHNAPARLIAATATTNAVLSPPKRIASTNIASDPTTAPSGRP
jgi:hypothetical protein